MTDFCHYALIKLSNLNLQIPADRSPPRLSGGAQDIDIQAGETLNIACQTDSGPVVWTKEVRHIANVEILK